MSADLRAQFRRVLMAAGLQPVDIEADGEWRRCPTDDRPRKKNGAYVLYPWGLGYYRDRAAGGDRCHAWRTDDENPLAGPSAEDLARLRQRRAEKREARRSAIHEARTFWAAAQPMRGTHPYIAGKGLTRSGCVALRQYGDMLIVPVMWRGRVLSLQAIAPDGTKLFWKDAPVKGGSLVLEREKATVTVVVEGLATGLAVYQAVPCARVIVAFDAGNLIFALHELRPSGRVVIGADNDRATEARRGFNPGLIKAREAAAAIGCGVAYPEGIKGTDWADWLAERGAAAAPEAARLIIAAARYVAPAPQAAEEVQQ